jgi:Tol biopolymer transport system component
VDPVGIRGNGEVRGESERFLFYDGTVDVPSPLILEWDDDTHRTLLLSTLGFGSYPKVSEGQRQLWGEDTVSDTTRESEKYPDSAPIPAVCVVSKEADGEARGKIVEKIESQVTCIRVPINTLSLQGEALHRAIGDILEKQGLTAEETRALLRTWEKEFFQTKGVRALTVIPRWLYDAMLPIEIDPAPGELVRVGIIWREGAKRKMAGEAEGQASAPSWTPEPVRILRTKVELTEEQLGVEAGVPFTIRSDGSISGFQFNFERHSTTHDGWKILLRELSTQSSGLYLADLDRKFVTRVATWPGDRERVFVEYYISGDGSRIFYANQKDEPPRLRIADLGRKKLLSAPPIRNHCSELVVSENGRRSAWIEVGGFDSGDRVSVLDIQSRELLQVQFEEPHTKPWAESCSGRLSISPDGQRLACTVRSNDGDGEIYLLDLEAETLLNVSRNPAEDGYPCLARGGRLVLFSSDRDRGESLYLADAEEGTVSRVVRQHGDRCRPWITEDGTQVFYALEGALWRKDLKTGGERKLISSETENVCRASISADGRRALVKWIDRKTRRCRTSLHEFGPK